MTGPGRYLVRMGIFLVIVAAAGGALIAKLQDAFLANVLLNGLIIGVLLLGILYIFRQVIMLRPEVEWVEQVRQEATGRLMLPSSGEKRPPRLLGPMATMLGERRGRVSLTAISMRSLLDGIQSRIEESHEISRYLIGLLVFLGLLGTFWGLLDTINEVGDTIGGLSTTGDDPAGFFESLKSGLEDPLGGMGTAFSSSLFGLAGSLVLGFLELQAGQAHNRFLNELEEWLSGITRLSSSTVVGDGDHSVPAYIQALLEKTADSLDQLQTVIARGEGDRATVNSNLISLTERLATLTDQMRAEQNLLVRLAESHNELRPILSRLADQDFNMGAMDDATRTHIRNVDLRLEQLVSDVSNGRDNAVKELRGEIRLLTRTIAAMAEETE